MRHLERTFGVELEAIAPSGAVSRHAVAAALTEAGIPTVALEYGHAPTTTWKVVWDGSLHSPFGMEIVSPFHPNALRGEEGFAQIARVSEVLLRLGLTVNRDCGLHVHVDVRRPRPLDMGALRRLALLYIEHETIWGAHMSPSRRQGGYSQRWIQSIANVNPNHIMASLDVDDMADALLGRNPALTRRHRQRRRPLGARDRDNERRYVTLNVTPHWTYGTVEFRQHQGTIETSKILNWVLATLRMVDYAEHHTDAQVVQQTMRTIRTARQGTKHHVVYNMLLRPEGASHPELLEATQWRQLSVMGIANSFGLSVRQQRERHNGKLTTRYFGTIDPAATATPTVQGYVSTRSANFEEFAGKLGMSEEEKSYWRQRAALFANA